MDLDHYRQHHTRVEVSLEEIDLSESLDELLARMEEVDQEEFLKAGIYV